MSGPEVVVLGAGSLFFGRTALWQMVHWAHLSRGTLGMVDTDARRLAQTEDSARRGSSRGSNRPRPTSARCAPPPG